MAECKKCNQKPTSKTQYFTIIVGVYLFPLIVWLIIYRNKDKIKSKEFERTYGPLKEGLKEKSQIFSLESPSFIRYYIL
jgi:hypothetical protein